MTPASPQDLLDMDRLRSTPVEPVPFPFLIVPNFVREGARAQIAADFPEITKAGSFPLPSLAYGAAFEALVAALCSPEMTKVMEDKFGLDLTDHPVMATVRGWCDARDGHIHTDSRTKLITMLLYMNDHPNADRGRLRLLRSKDIDDVAAEVPPDEGTLLVFLNGSNAWHGFPPIDGPRRSIQVNWVTDGSVVRREQARHRVSAFFKRLVTRHAAAY